MSESVRFEALHAAAFMVDADQHILTNALYVSAQLAELAAIFPVAGEQNNATGKRMFKAPPVGFGQSEAGYVDDQRGVLNWEVSDILLI